MISSIEVDLEVAEENSWWHSLFFIHRFAHSSMGCFGFLRPFPAFFGRFNPFSLLQSVKFGWNPQFPIFGRNSCGIQRQDRLGFFEIASGYEDIIIGRFFNIFSSLLFIPFFSKIISNCLGFFKIISSFYHEDACDDQKRPFSEERKKLYNSDEAESIHRKNSERIDDYVEVKNPAQTSHDVKWSLINVRSSLFDGNGLNWKFSRSFTFTGFLKNILFEISDVI